MVFFHSSLTIIMVLYFRLTPTPIPMPHTHTDGSTDSVHKTSLVTGFPFGYIQFRHSVDRRHTPDFFCVFLTFVPKVFTQLSCATLLGYVFFCVYWNHPRRVPLAGLNSVFPRMGEKKKINSRSRLNLLHLCRVNTVASVFHEFNGNGS